MKRKRTKTRTERNEESARPERYGREFGEELDLGSEFEHTARFTWDDDEEGDVDDVFNVERWERDLRARSSNRQRMRARDERRGLFDARRLRWRDDDDEYEAD